MDCELFMTRRANLLNRAGHFNGYNAYPMLQIGDDEVVIMASEAGQDMAQDLDTEKRGVAAETIYEMIG